MLELAILFFSSLIAATIFPAQSEIILAGLLIAGNHSNYLLWLIASVGNILGSVINWFMGAYLMKFQDRKWFFVKECKIEKYIKIYRKWGVWLLLFAWLPVVGDPITVIAGMSRVNIWLFLLLVGVGKAGRYLIEILVFLN